MFVVTTDGMENASTIYSLDDVKKMIEHQKSKYGWEFLFIGANIDAVKTAHSIGIAPDRTVNYHADGEGTGIVFDSVSKTVGRVRNNEKVPDDWCSEIFTHFKNKK